MQVGVVEAGADYPFGSSPPSNPAWATGPAQAGVPAEAEKVWKAIPPFCWD